MSSFWDFIKRLFRGYGSDGYDRHGFNKSGFDRQGYDKYGFNIRGTHRDTGTRLDPDGYNQFGFDLDGEHRDYAALKGKRFEIIDKGVIRFDMHGMSLNAAERSLSALLSGLRTGEYTQLVLVHGYSHGNVLKTMVRSYDHPRIKNIVTETRNEGITVYELI